MEILLINDAKERRKVCKSILEKLPDWFGIPEAIDEYAEGCADESTRFFAAMDGGEAVGFMALRPQFSATDELYVTGVLADRHRSGVGSTLLEACEADARSRGVQLISVKTLDSSAESSAYDKTRAFYLSKGFLPVECFKTLWDEANPCLFLVKIL